MTKKKPRKWTKEALLKSASNYTTVKDWRTKEPSAYATASQQKLLPELTAHMHKGIVHGYWTKQRILDSAKKFDQISKWAEEYHAAYSKAGQLGIRERATAHMIPVGNKKKRCVYTIKVLNTNLIYVGLTGNIKRRYRDHLKTKRFKSLAKQYGESSIICEQKSDYIHAEEAQYLERQYCLDSLAEGMELLNKAPAGGLGGTTLKWTKDAILKDAKRFKTVKGWIKSKTRSYAAASAMGVIDEAAAHMKREIKKPGSWTREEIIERASNFKQISEWLKNEPASYGAAQRHGYLEDPLVVGHFNKGAVINKKWTKEAVLLSALKFSNRAAWKKSYGQAYKAARKYEWFDEAVAHMTYRPKPEPKWTKSSVLRDAKRFKHKIDWKNKSGGAYAAANKNGWYEEATMHMVTLNPKGKWSSKAAILQDANKYFSKSAWNRGSSGAYEAAKKIGCFDEATAHMKALRKKWTAKEILLSAEKHTKFSEWRKEDESRYRGAVRLKLVEKVKSKIKKHIENLSAHI